MLPKSSTRNRGKSRTFDSLSQLNINKLGPYKSMKFRCKVGLKETLNFQRPSFALRNDFVYELINFAQLFFLVFVKFCFTVYQWFSRLESWRPTKSNEKIVRLTKQYLGNFIIKKISTFDKKLLTRIAETVAQEDRSTCGPHYSRFCYSRFWLFTLIFSGT
jgi:hypothetical protein